MSRYNTVIAGCTIALSSLAALTGLAQAQEPAQTTPAASQQAMPDMPGMSNDGAARTVPPLQRHGSQPRMHARRGFMKQLEALHAQLGLNDKQEALWRNAVSTMQNNHERMRAMHRAMHERTAALHAQPILDLDALAKAHEQAWQEQHTLHMQTQQAWLKTYAALNDQQKTIVSNALRTRWQRMEARHKQWMMHHEGQEGRAGGQDMPAGPAAASAGNTRP